MTVDTLKIFGVVGNKHPHRFAHIFAPILFFLQQIVSLLNKDARIGYAKSNSFGKENYNAVFVYKTFQNYLNI